MYQWIQYPPNISSDWRKYKKLINIPGAVGHVSRASSGKYSQPAAHHKQDRNNDSGILEISLQSYELQILQKFLIILTLKSNIQLGRADVPMFYSPILCKFCMIFTHKISNFRQKLKTVENKKEITGIDTERNDLSR